PSSTYTNPSSPQSALDYSAHAFRLNNVIRLKQRQASSRSRIPTTLWRTPENRALTQSNIACNRTCNASFMSVMA
ncbi:hypothetical protein COCCADRAFT_96229, partial [Bipolaris zeicola 26-R-13]